MARTVKNHREEPAIEVGDIDPASSFVRNLGIPKCMNRTIDPGMDERVYCTRPAGHDEDPHAKHVYAPRGRALHIWEDTP